MFILKNAWISIKRNKGRNILIGIIILIIACACTITLAIKNTAEDLIGSYKSAYDKEVTISFDRASMMKDFDPSQNEGRENAREKFDNIASYTISDIKSFADSKYIESYYYTYSIGLNGNNIEKAEIESNNDMPNGFGHGKGNNISSTDFTLTGYSSLDAMSEFINGTYTMNEITDNAWDIAFDGNYVFINEELASYNDLSLNDKIKLEDEDGNTYEFEIIGIFKENEEESTNTMSMFSASANTIITNASAVTTITTSNENLKATINPTFIIDSYDNVEKLQDEFYEKGLDENFILQTNEEIALSGVSSIENINSFATTFLVITLIIGGIVLFVINMINIRERKYEIGVLRTIGISKFKLTIQFVSELVIVSTIALILGAGIGALSSKGVSNYLLESEINNSNERTEEIGKNFGRAMNGGMLDRGNKGEMRGKGMPVVEAYDSIDAVVDIKVLLELLGIGLTLVLVSSISSMVSIERFSPLTILKERS